jgi:tetratricopeptide (TPR) repeat protein
VDLLVRVGQRDQAREAFQRAIGAGLPDNLHYMGRVLLSEACIALGEAAQAERLLALLAPLSGRCVVWVGQFCVCDGAIARLFGGLTALVGRFDEAERYFDAALQENERLGATAWLARTRFAFARVLERRGGPGDAARVRDLDAQAAETFGALEMESFLREPRPVAAPRGPLAAPRLAREGEYFTLAGAGAPIRLRDSDGLRYIDHLLRHPCVEFHATDLLPLGRRGDAEVPGSGDAGPLLDREARAAYRRRLEDLRETLSEAEQFNDRARAERARAEIEHLTAELSRAVGLSGRERRAASAAERARVNVTLRIRNAIKKIEEFSPAVAHQLASCIHTGTFCRYTPPPPR